MGRFIREVKLDQPIDVVSMVMDDFIYHHRFQRTDWNGEMVFGAKDRYGKEWYLKWAYTAGVFHLEAWKKGVFGGEAGFERSSRYRRDINELLGRLKSQDFTRMTGGHVGSDPIHHNGDVHNHDAWRKDTDWQGQNEKAQSLMQENNELSGRNQRTGAVGLVLAVMAIFFGIQSMVVGIILLVLSRKNAKNSGYEQIVKALNFIAAMAIWLNLVIRIFHILQPII